jgi:hypothetical protein
MYFVIFLDRPTPTTTALCVVNRQFASYRDARLYADTLPERRMARIVREETVSDDMRRERLERVEARHGPDPDNWPTDEKRHLLLRASWGVLPERGPPPQCGNNEAAAWVAGYEAAREAWRSPEHWGIRVGPRNAP